MNGTVVVTVVSAAFGSAGFFALLQFLIARRDKKKDTLGKIVRKLDKLEKDSCRTQLLLLISDYPDNHAEILELACHYFSDLRGNWYMSTLFEKWLEKSGLRVPDWYRRG